MLSKTTQGFNGEEENNRMGDGHDWVLMLRKSMAERNMRFFEHIVRKNSMEKILIQRKMKGKRPRGRPAKTYFKDLKD